MNNVQSKFRHIGVVALIALAVVGGVTYSVSAWSTPSSPPPAGNVAGPITTGSAAQTKSGNFTIGSGYSLSASNICLSGSCKTAWPVPTTACIAGQALTWNGSLFSCVSAGGGSDIWQKNGNDIYYNDGKVGIGTPSPAAPIHIKNTIGDMTFGAANYTGAISGGTSWPNYIGTVVKKGSSEVIVGIGGLGGDAPGISARNGAGPQVDLFAHGQGLAILQSGQPIVLQTNQVGIGSFSYGTGEKPAANLMLHVKGNVGATGNVFVAKAADGNALVQVKASSAGVARLDLETDTTNDASMIQYFNKGLTITGNALDVINLQVPDVVASTKITSPQYCIGTNCITAWPPKPGAACAAGQALTWNGTAYSCIAVGGADNLGNHTAIVALNMSNNAINNATAVNTQYLGVTNASYAGIDIKTTDSTKFAYIDLEAGGLDYASRLQYNFSDKSFQIFGNGLQKVKFNVPLDMGGSGALQKITNVLNPTAGQDVATKAYVDSRTVTLFGGAFERGHPPAGSASTCWVSNPITGGCSCPTGYAEIPGGMTYHNSPWDGRSFICYRNY